MTTTETVERRAPTDQAQAAASVIVFRRDGRAITYLLLHDAGSDAWQPPSGHRQPAESPKACARRHVVEDTGMHLYPIPTAFGTEDCDVYLAQAVPGSDVTLSGAHDRYEWVEATEAAGRCGALAASIGRVAALVEHA